MSERSGSQPPSCKLLHVVGTRPNYMKVAPVMAAVSAWNDGDRETHHGDLAATRFEQVLVHTGQHYDANMSDIFFRDLDLPEPDHFLGVGSGSHAAQTASVMTAIEPVVVAEAPDLLIVVGDVTSTLAAALVAAKLNFAVAHVEAGLRSFDRAMPEEVNRVLTDHLSELLFTTCQDGDQNLAREGIAPERVFRVGNTMIDSLDATWPAISASSVVEALGLAPDGFAVATLHRPSNVDEPDRLRALLDMLDEIGTRIPVVFPMHARTRARMPTGAGRAHGGGGSGLRLVDPLGYVDFVALVAGARLVLTDSGGIQEETTVLGVPCLTLRTSTERPITIREGTNRLLDPFDAPAIVAAVDEILAAGKQRPARPEGWDGRAGRRIVDVVAEWWARRHS